MSDLAITGLYFFDNKVVRYAKSLNHQKGEIEIVDLINKYKKNKNLSADIIGRGGAGLIQALLKILQNECICFRN